MGLCAVQGVGEVAWARIEAARRTGPFATLRDVCRRTRLPQDVISHLIRAGALDALGKRRDLLWQLGSLDYAPDSFDLETPVIAVDLPDLAPLEQTRWEYELLGFAPDAQLLVHYRPALRKRRVLSTWQVKRIATPGQRVRVGGLVVVRQRPQTAQGVLFISLEDESGLLDLVVKPDVYPLVRPVLQSTLLVIATGLVQRSAHATSLLVQSLAPLQQLIST